MAGIYIHIPFCKQACYYCDFHFSTSLKNKDALIEAILLEIIQRKKDWKDESFDTIYFGGGTPSIVNADDIDKIIKALYKHYNINEKPEISLEANPDDVTEQKIKKWKASGVNRMSVGIQSFHQEDLIKLHRSHTANQAVDAVKRIQDHGIDNITIDLIYGIPGLTDEKLQYNLQQVFDFDIPHVSAYALTVEPKTVLAHQIEKNIFPKVSDSQASHQFKLLRNSLKQAGFLHYEVSNFSKPDCISQHNSSYWKNKPYIGLGPAAHSYNKTSRRWNINNNALYIKRINEDTYYEIEQLSQKDRYNEMIMTGLRTMWGVDLQEIKTLGGKYYDHLMKQSKRYLDAQQLILTENAILAHPSMLFLIESVIADLFM